MPASLKLEGQVFSRLNVRKLKSEDVYLRILNGEAFEDIAKE